jgi:hypothetical protein
VGNGENAVCEDVEKLPRRSNEKMSDDSLPGDNASSTRFTIILETDFSDDALLPLIHQTSALGIQRRPV